MVDYVIREDGEGKLMINTKENNMPPLKYILAKEYDYIYDSLMDDYTFVIDGVVPNVFKEIVVDNKVVGFSSYDSGMGVMCLKYIYVLPEFRGNNLLIKDLSDTKNLFENEGYPHVAISIPNYFVIKSLVKHGYANECGRDNHLVISNIPLVFTVKDGKDINDDDLEWFKNKGIDVDVDNMKEMNLTTFLYDKDICACVSLDFGLISPMCDVDSRNNPRLMMNRMVDADEYFLNLGEEIKSLVDEGVMKII